MFRTFALHQSLLAHNPHTELHVLVADEPEKVQAIRQQDLPLSNLYIYTLSEVCKDDISQKIIRKYLGVNMDSLRWSLKPVLIRYLLTEKQCVKVLFLDNDLFFLQPYDFLWDELAQGRILLSPHWRSMHPYVDPDSFINNFTDGIYNGGFVGVTNKAIDIMNWWAEVCEYRCDKAKSEGFFVDQKYLDLLHSRFEGVRVLRHQGCNVAYWNQTDCKRTQVGNKVLINGRVPIVFIHFTSYLIADIDQGEDPLLQSHLKHYLHVLAQGATIQEELLEVAVPDNWRKRLLSH